jgi:hypothetical protein
MKKLLAYYTNKVQHLIIHLTKFNSQFKFRFPKPPFKVQKAFRPDKHQIGVSADRLAKTQRD